MALWIYIAHTAETERKFVDVVFLSSMEQEEGMNIRSNLMWCLGIFVMVTAALTRNTACAILGFAIVLTAFALLDY